MDHFGAQGVSRIRLLEAAPQLGRLLGDTDREELHNVTVAVDSLPEGTLDRERLNDANAFGAIVLDGVLMHRVTLWEHPAMRLLGQGDVLTFDEDGQTALGSQSTYRAITPLRLVMLDDRVLYIAHRIPRLFAALQRRTAEQHDRLAVQLVICQMSRVDDRILAMLWLLAETWGRVTTAGTVLPIALTHDALGELVGARRPTISLALKALTENGSLVRQEDGWLLLKPIPDAGDSASPLRDGAVAVHAGSDPAWKSSPPEPAFEAEALKYIVATLRDTHARTAEEVRIRLQGSHRIRAESAALRQGLATRRRARRPAPSA
jgi:CRP-like cAMP-binding protein